MYINKINIYHHEHRIHANKYYACLWDTQRNIYLIKHRMYKCYSFDTIEADDIHCFYFKSYREIISILAKISGCRVYWTKEKDNTIVCKLSRPIESGRYSFDGAKL